MSENENNDSKTGNHRPADTYDFGQRRVAGILRREKPMCEQEEASFKLHVEEMVRMLGVSGNTQHIHFEGKLWLVGRGIQRGHTCTIRVQAECATVSYWARKRGVANLNSRFLPPLSPV